MRITERQLRRIIRRRIMEVVNPDSMAKREVEIPMGAPSSPSVEIHGPSEVTYTEDDDENDIEEAYASNPTPHPGSSTSEIDEDDDEDDLEEIEGFKGAPAKGSGAGGGGFGFAPIHAGRRYRRRKR